MARFRASIQGTRGEASRLGHSDIVSETNGWNSGVRVRGVDAEGKDEFHIYATSGSNGRHASKYIGTVVIGIDGRPEFIPGNLNG